jgi:hypothetical protein
VYIRPAGQSTFTIIAGENSTYSYCGLTGVGSDVYCSQNGAGANTIRKRTGGVGAFEAYNTSSDRSSVFGLAYSPYSNKLYHINYNGAGVFRWTPGGTASSVWANGHQSYNAAVSAAGDIYLTTWNNSGPHGGTLGYCYKQVGETGSFVSMVNSFPEVGGELVGLSNWKGVGAAKNGDVYISDATWIYRQAAGESLFYRFQALANVSQFSGADDGSVYASCTPGDIYMLRSPVSKLKYYAQIIG